jgi:signal peptidase I
MEDNRFQKTSISVIRKALSKFGYFKFIVKGTSMFPFLLEGDEVTIVKIDPSEFEIGDIAMYVRNNLMIVHRIVNVYRCSDGRRFFILMGDNLRYADRPVFENEICGKVIRVKRGDFEFSPMRFKPHTISIIKRLINAVRFAKQKLGLRINQEDIIDILRRSRI